MGNNFQFNLYEQEQMTSRERWLDQLSNYIIVDTGIISSPSLTSQGYRCRVKPFRLYAGQQIVYDGVEVLLPGNSMCGIDVDLNGASCIVFGPYSSATSIESRGIIGANKPYDLKYLKCIPVGNLATWKSKLQFDGNGNCSFQTADTTFMFGVDGSVEFTQEIPQQQISVDAEGICTWQTPVSTGVYYPDGTYYRFERGSEPGSFQKFESFINNIEDSFKTTIDTFEEEDSELTIWEQLLAFNKWKYRYSYDRETGNWHKYTRSEAGKFDYYESFVDGIHDTYWSTLEDVEEEDGDEADKWDQLDGATWRKHKQHDTTTGVEFVEQYDADGNLLSREDFNPDGSRALVNTDADGNNLFSASIADDGTATVIIGYDDAEYTLTVNADGTGNITIGDTVIDIADKQLDIAIGEDVTASLTDSTIDIAIGSDVTASLTDSTIDMAAGNASVALADGKGEVIVDKAKLTTDGSGWVIDAGGCKIEATSSKVTIAGNLEVSK